MLFCWGENECLRAWTINAAGVATFVGKSAEIASASPAGNRGGMPGGLLAISSNGTTPNTGIIWALAPISGDAIRLFQSGNTFSKQQVRIAYPLQERPHLVLPYHIISPFQEIQGSPLVDLRSALTDSTALAMISVIPAS